MERILFDFFNETHTEWLKSFCAYFRLSEEVVASYFDEVNPDELTPGKLTQDLNVNLTDYDSNNLSIICRHMTTASNADKESFQIHGILNLKRMLQEKTALSDFIKTNGITVDVDNRKIYINQQSYPITSYGEPCEFCFEGRKAPCEAYFKCNPRTDMEHLGRKLYKYGATVEFFTHATIDQMERYSSIRRCPEILQTLDKIVSSINGFSTSAYKMSYDWMKAKPECYILEFPVQLSDMETYSLIDYDRTWYEVSHCLEQSGYNQDDYYERLIPQNVLDNIIFLKWFISVYFYDSEKLGSLLPDMCVEPEEIRRMIEV
ncbi:hypothetical protein [Anaerocolumna aminovalerica]|uniref:hypothetical protein n=1 Tax=Anaerocolumna aminovalerica TaxID=1527 RepID=UPI000BE32E9E|nr:hypothetical protein [Anaerocolumna aminovalerica]